MNCTTADHIEYFMDHLLWSVECWQFDGHDFTEDIKEFFLYCKKESKILLETPRCPDGLNYLQRREIEINSEQQ